MVTVDDVRERSVQRMRCRRERWRNGEHPAEIRRKGEGGWWTARPVVVDTEEEFPPAWVVDLWYGPDKPISRREVAAVLDDAVDMNRVLEAFRDGWSPKAVRRVACQRSQPRRRVSDPLTGPLRRNEGTIDLETWRLRQLSPEEQAVIVTAHRCAARVANAGAPVSWSDLRRGCSSSARPLLEQAVAHAVENGLLRECAPSRQCPGRRFEIA